VRSRYLFLSVVLVLAAGIARSGRAQGDEQAIRKGDAEWSHAAETKDLEKTVSCYAKDGSVLPFGAPIATGEEQVRQVWSHLMSLPGFSLTFAPTKVQVAKAGDIAYEVGTFALKLNQPRTFLIRTDEATVARKGPRPLHIAREACELLHSEP
jgi:ketosteroid isomerase-like protein